MTLKGRKEWFTSEDTVNQSFMLDYTDEVLVLSYHIVENFKEEYSTPENQLVIARGGFGCSPDTMGSVIIGEFVSDGERVGYRRQDFVGVLKPKLVEEYGIKVK